MLLTLVWRNGGSNAAEKAVRKWKLIARINSSETATAPSQVLGVSSESVVEKVLRLEKELRLEKVVENETDRKSSTQGKQSREEITTENAVDRAADKNVKLLTKKCKFGA